MYHKTALSKNRFINATKPVFLRNEKYQLFKTRCIAAQKENFNKTCFM